MAGAGLLKRRLGVIALVIGTVALPVNTLPAYAILVAVTLLTFTGDVTQRARIWALAFAIVAIAAGGKWLLSPPPIEEGHNVFLGEHADALKAGLPADVFNVLQTQFDSQYPREKRCDPSTVGCWRGEGVLFRLKSLERDAAFPFYRPCLTEKPGCLREYGFPNRVFAFSADAIFGSAAYSRRVNAIDFSDPTWLRLGFLNDGAYNWWPSNSDVQRGMRDLPFWMGIHRWRVTMPFFVMYQFPRAYAGAELCWRGDVMWENPTGHFDLLPHRGMSCRSITGDDAGKSIFGLAIKPGTLAMSLKPPLAVRAALWTKAALTWLAAGLVLFLLVRVKVHRIVLPALLMGMALATIVIIDVTTLGGFRVHEGGNDGLFYEAAGRMIAQAAALGDWQAALQGGESVFYFGGPGLRYLRAIERFAFGETNFGYVSLLLLFPIVTFAVFRRFLSPGWALILALIFLATPIGAFFGSTFFLYVKYALQGFGDTASYLFFLCATWALMGPVTPRADNRFARACLAGFCFFLAVFVRPVVAPATGVMLAGAGLAALSQHHWRRVAGLCVGFLPVIAMPLHNWYFGNVFVLFSANTQAKILHMTLSSYGMALRELFRLDFSGIHLYLATLQLLEWPMGFFGQWHVGGRIGYAISMPFHVAAIALLVYVVGWGRRFDPWLRLIAAATLTQHMVALFYGGAARYFFLTWFLNMLVVAVWMEQEGLAFLKKHFPAAALCLNRYRLPQRIAVRVEMLEGKSGPRDSGMRQLPAG